MQNEIDILRDVSARLDGANIGYLLTGSMAMNCYGQLPMTGDIDLVVALRPADAARITRLFSPDYHAVFDAVHIARTSGFILFQNESEIRVGCTMLKQTEYRLNEFNRRQRIKIEGFETWIVSKEDLILSKLKLFWGKDVHADLQLRDIKHLVSTGCDRAYIDRWTWGLGITSLEQAVAA
jgi:hypothetical protein